MYSEINHIRIAVSYYCNLKCKHCYVPLLNRRQFKELERQQLSVKEIKDYIDYLIKDFNLQKVTITGGEPLLNKVWPRTKELLNYVFSKGLDVQLNTSCSGQVHMKEIAQIAKKYNSLNKILLHASLDGVKEEQVDKFRGIKGAYKNAIKTLKNAVKEGISVQVRYTITKENYHDALNCYDLVSEIGVESYMAKPMYIAGNAVNNKEILIKSKEDIKQLQEKLIEKSIDNKIRLDLPLPVFIDIDNIPSDANCTIIGCNCGGSEAYLDYNGDILPCSYLVGAQNSKRFVIGNIKDINFGLKKVWKSNITYSSFRNASKTSCTSYEILIRDFINSDKNQEKTENAS